MDGLNINDIPISYGGDSFHGEVWCNCPICGKPNELMGNYDNIVHKDNYLIIKCKSCNKFFKRR